ncbi:hypothetical protein D0C36_20160 [Mucilaginibacter conchicola]|uniref:Signal transduction histidine kinase internal region domain-containing protein n=1 Tax=Mucilaginibacter conchicola TaxID=2303333 RepID=A0A372NRI5_9SPHI|nr:histidine kinase [Mucilaginibacter conchicola]RFZ91250.1 hypothetical protein D0C36_20160 [Mucilaginibacter conchicola]
MKIIRKDHLFWPVQISAWLIAALVNFMAQQRLPMNPTIRYLNSIGLFAGGLIVTSVFRYYVKKYGPVAPPRPLRVIALLLLASFLQAITWILIYFALFLPVAGVQTVPYTEMLVNLVPMMAVLLVWNLGYSGYHLIRRYHRSEVEKWQLEAEVQKAALGALKAQINPHFLFNSLNNIRALILEDPQLAREMITGFSELFRYALQYSEHKEVRLSEEIKMLDDFVKLLKIQYEGKLQYTISADPATLYEKIPPMVLQLLVENAVKHGIAVSSGAGEISVEISYSGRALSLTVKNTGIMARKNELEDSLGIGLQNIRSRLALLYGQDASLSFSEIPPFIVVEIRINK